MKDPYLFALGLAALALICANVAMMWNRLSALLTWDGQSAPAKFDRTVYKLFLVVWVAAGIGVIALLCASELRTEDNQSIQVENETIP